MSKIKPRILIVSMRSLYSQAFRSAEYEFEDAICTFDDADMLVPEFADSFSQKISKKLGNYAGLTLGNGKLLKSGCQTSIVDKEYDLLFFICQHFWDITCINSIKGWRQKCKKAVLWIDEIWAKEVMEHKTKLCLKIVNNFDYIFTTQANSVQAIANLIQRPCYSLPYAVDAIKFCPYPLQPQRNIDVYSIGRRSPIIHKSLVKLADNKDFLYLHDTLKGLQMIDYQEHRTLYSNLIKRSRYFIANKAKFDTIHQTGGQEELGSRFFEGAAGGTVMIGIPPVCEAYNTYFNWQDAVIPIAYNTANLADIIAELDAQPERIKKISQNNIINSLLRHDWVYRWGQILDKVGFEQTPQMLSRQADLNNLAKLVSSSN